MRRPSPRSLGALELRRCRRRRLRRRPHRRRDGRRHSQNSIRSKVEKASKGTASPVYVNIVFLAAFLRRLENYEIVQPRRSRAGNDRVRRRADDNVAYTIEAFGKTFQLELTPNRRLVTAEFAVRRRRQHRVDETTIDIDTSCYHVGRVRGNRGSGAAVSSCGGGLVRTKKGGLNVCIDDQWNASS